MTRPCLGCGVRTTGSRCPTCERTKRGVTNGWQWTAIRAQVWARDRACVICADNHNLEVHHVIPLAEGGTNQLYNLELRCQHCHREAHVPFSK